MTTTVILGSLAQSLTNFRAPLLDALRQAGHSVVGVAPDLEEKDAKHLQAFGAHSARVEFSRTGMNPLADVLGFFRLWTYFRKSRPNAVLAYTAKPVIYGMLASRLAGVQTRAALITGLGFAFTEGTGFKRKLARIIAWTLYRLALPRATTIIFQNPDDLALFKSLGLISRQQRVEIVNGSGVDLKHFARVPLPEKPVFLMIARLLVDKGVREYAEAAVALKAERPDAAVRLVGWLDKSPGAVSAAELDQWQKAGLEFLGRLDDVRPAIAKASVIVLPSYREGTPRSVLEGMAMGRAVITTDAPGCRETVAEGVNGLLVPPRDAASLAKAMIRLAQNPETIRKMGEASYRIAQTKYEAGAVALDTLRKAGIVGSHDQAPV
jgi:glycosyltransferase involved in cell wall biosynthesis